jgi:transposase InsO family protein
MRMAPCQRRTIVDAVKRGISVHVVAEVFKVSRTTVWRWRTRAYHPGRESFRDKQRESPPRKITPEVESSIIAVRLAFRWGTARIQQALMSLPGFMKTDLSIWVQDVSVSRTAINSVLRRHHLNGYEKKQSSWKFFQARKPDELWQLDIKGPFTVRGKRHWFIVCIDDYSRYLLVCEQLNHDPTTREITSLLERLPRKPKSILIDNGVQFKKHWRRWCRGQDVTALFAHPYYPQDKGKVERAIRNIAEEFVNLLRKFPQWLDGRIREYREWYNTERFHRGIHCRPIQLY